MFEVIRIRETGPIQDGLYETREEAQVKVTQIIDRIGPKNTEVFLIRPKREKT